MFKRNGENIWDWETVNMWTSACSKSLRCIKQRLKTIYYVWLSVNFQSWNINSSMRSTVFSSFKGWLTVTQWADGCIATVSVRVRVLVYVRTKIGEAEKRDWAKRKLKSILIHSFWLWKCIYRMMTTICEYGVNIVRCE